VGRARTAAETAARALLERLGVSERAAQYPPTLSGGEQQRVAFCRAVLNDPAVILADEPTGNLDEENAAVLLAELRVRAHGGRSAVLLVTHSVDLARTADRVLTLANGRLTGVRL
jgi:ABC-type lipoprotein export system ATPase subunit